MAYITRQRLTAQLDGDFVVFMIGMRVNKPWKIHKWLPVFTAMPKMLRELTRQPELGLLEARLHVANPLSPMVVEYWRSFEQLEAYAHSRDNEHLPAWRAFNKHIASNGDVGIWHETFLVKAGQYESVYNNMPIFGLAKAGTPVPATGGRTTARGRLEGEGAAAPSKPLESGSAPTETP